ncbi:MAG: Rpn family recombination-promoting nuclease/putative transposase [Flavobacteriales bacterium]|jgi:predicted transposase/invertase (TIGR01784 family)|nr:Rpn family recombination-promoting nuclease/putative transposase [Flavobacteriales bacterium]
MTGFEEKYINPFTDFGFKKLFGEEPNKDLLLDFLNELLKEKEGNIKSITYLKNEHVGRLESDRRAIFDIYCENEKGEKFIVEIQKTKQNFFKDRTVYYSTFPIQEQAKKLTWDFSLKGVYTIAILDFIFDENKNNPDKYRYDVMLTDIETKEVFYDKLTFIYLEMPKFNKTIDELETQFEKWLYVLRNLPNLQKRPDKLQEKVFAHLFEVAEVAKLSKKELMYYEDSMKVYRDLENSLETKYMEGKLEGKAEGIEQGIEQKNIDIVLNSFKLGLDISIIQKLTGLTEEEIKRILEEQ